MVRRARGAFVVVPALLAIGGACDDGASTSGGGAGAGGIGEPSDVHPAPHAAPPEVLHAGGPVLAAPAVVPIVFAGDEPLRVAVIEDLLAKVGPSDYWAETTAEYGVGPLAVRPTVEVAQGVGVKISPAEIVEWLKARLELGDTSLPEPFPGALYMLLYPPGVDIEDANGAACTAYSGYHGSFALGAARGGAEIAYAVVPACEEFYGETALETLTSTISHELIEAVTDPYGGAPAWQNIDPAHAYWTFVFGGGEVSDMCNLWIDANVKLPGTTYPVQRSWSNVAARAGRDPCVPPLPGKVYFNAAPDMADDLLLPNGVTSKGVRIAEGATRTIAVRLFSEGPTAPIKVYPEDYAELLGGEKQLELSLDEAEGLNGQVLHLTIKVLGDKATQLFRLTSTDGQQFAGWIGAVGR